MIRKVVGVGLGIFLLAAATEFVVIDSILGLGDPWEGTLWTVASLGLLLASVLLGQQAARNQQHVAAGGFLLVGLAQLPFIGAWAFGFRGLDEAELGSLIVYGVIIGTGLLVIGISDRFDRWIRAAGILQAAAMVYIVAHLMIGLDTPDIFLTPLPWIIWLLFLFVTHVGWLIDVWRDSDSWDKSIDTKTESALSG